LRRAGFQVAAAKITGTAAGKDSRYFTSCGARPVLDFTHAGYPSTYMISLEELLDIHRTLVGHLMEENPDYVIVEVADGIFQRETRMLLEDPVFRRTVEHVFFAANDSLSADCGARCLKAYGLPLRAIGGSFSQSTLAMREAEAATGVRCLNLEQMMRGGVLEAMGIPEQVKTPAAAVDSPAHSFSNNGHPAGLPASNGNGAQTVAVEEDAEVSAPAETVTA
jgi:hypothetical protein